MLLDKDVTKRSLWGRTSPFVSARIRIVHTVPTSSSAKSNSGRRQAGVAIFWKANDTYPGLTWAGTFRMASIEPLFGAIFL